MSAGRSETMLLGLTDSDIGSYHAIGLRKAGLKVHEVNNGLCCLAELQRSTYSLLIVNFHLLWGGGDGVVEWMLSEDSVTNIPVVIIDIPSVVVEAHADACIVQPMAISELVRVVRLRLGNIQMKTTESGT